MSRRTLLRAMPEDFEARLMLAAVLYVDDNYTITNDVAPAGLSTDDTVTFAPGEGNEVAGLTFGTNAFSTVPDALAAAAIGDTIQIGTGTFIHIGQLSITKSVTIAGSGQNATVIQRSGAVGGSENRTIELQSNNITLEHLTLGGWSGGSGLGNGYLAWLTNADFATFDDVHFSGDTVRVALYVGGSGNGDDLTVTNSRFTGSYSRGTIRGGGERMNISDNSFEEVHNYLAPTAQSEWYSSIYMEYAGPVSGTISGNFFAAGVVGTVTPSANNGAYTITNWRTVGVDGLTVSHNTFDLLNGDVLGAQKFVPAGVYSDPALAAAGQITIQDNIFRGYTYQGAQPANTPQYRAGLGQFGGALEFDGIDDFASFDFGANELGDRGTLNFWVKMDNTTKRNQFFEGPGNAGFEVQYRTNSGGQVYGRTTTVGGDFAIRSGGDAATLAGNWTNIQVIWDFDGLPAEVSGGKLRVYLNGVESSYLTNFTPTDLTWAAVNSTVNGIMNMGRDPGDSTRGFDGLMDDVAWYDVVLTTAERNTVRGTGVATGAITPVASWNFDSAPSGNTYAGDNGSSIVLTLGSTVQSSAIASSSGTLVDYNLFFNNDVNFNSAVSAGANNLVGDPLFTGTDPFQNGVNVPANFYSLLAASPALLSASDATNRGASQLLPPITVTLEVAPNTFAETGGQTTVTANLSSVSVDPVTVTLSYSGLATLGTDYTAATQIVIPAGQLSGSIVIHAVSDLIDEVDETVIIDIASVVNAFEVGTQQVTATILDDDTAGFLVTPTGLSTVVSETGTSDEFSVRLTSQPLTNVVINVTSTNLGEGTVSPAFLTFTPGNWNVGQVVTVTGVADGVADGDQNFDVLLAVNAALSDNAFDNLAVVGVPVTNKDIDGVARYDFVKTVQGTAPDYQAVLPTSLYSPATGFGWLSGPLEAVDTGPGSADEVARDFHFIRTGSRTFQADRVNGVYDVTVVIGSAIHAINKEGVQINGIDLGQITLNAGQFHTQTVRLEVVDGKVEVTISRQGGSIAVIGGLVISAVTDDPYVVATDNSLEYLYGSPELAIDPNISVTDPNDATLVSATIRIVGGFNAAQDDLRFINQNGITGSYASATGVLTLTGTATVLQYEAALRSIKYFNSAASPTPLSRTVLFEVRDAAGGKGSDTREIRLINPVGPSSFDFDFVKKAADTAAGYTTVLTSNIYTTGTGFGWLDNTALETFDSGAGNPDDVRDFHFFRVGSRTFRTNVSNGEYDVTVNIGSTVHGFTKEGVLINGTQVDQLTTTPGVFETRTYRVLVTDGRIDLTIARQGGTFVGIAGLSIDRIDI